MNRFSWHSPFTDISMATVMDESKLQPISVLCICSVYYCGEDTEETGERHQVIMLGSTLATGHGHRTRAYGGQW